MIPGAADADPGFFAIEGEFSGLLSLFSSFTFQYNDENYNAG